MEGIIKLPLYVVHFCKAADPQVATIFGRTVRWFTTSDVLGIGKGALGPLLKTPGYEAFNNVWSKLGRVRVTSPVFFATKLNTLAPTSYLPRVWSFQLASIVAISE